MKSPGPALAHRLATATPLALILGAALTGCGAGSSTSAVSAPPGSAASGPFRSAACRAAAPPTWTPPLAH